jgi:lactobin A/cerein 7B family class IIb bacteriocin
MRELSNIEIEQVSGGVIPAFLAGVALGSLAKKLYLKYK